MVGICPQEAPSRTSSAHGQANTSTWRGITLGTALPNFLSAGGSQSPLRPLSIISLNKLSNHRQKEHFPPLQSSDRYHLSQQTKANVWMCLQPALHKFLFSGPKSDSWKAKSTVTIHSWDLFISPWPIFPTTLHRWHCRKTHSPLISSGPSPAGLGSPWPGQWGSAKEVSALPADQFRPAAGGLGSCHGLVHQQGKSGGEQMAADQGSPPLGAQSLQPNDSKVLCSLLLCVGTFTVLNPRKGDQDMICMETEAAPRSKSRPGPLSGGSPSPDCLGKPLTLYPSTRMGLEGPARCDRGFPLSWSKLPSRGEGRCGVG